MAARPDTALEGTPDPGPNWNFNVSHEGHFVVLAAEPLLLCGVDVAAPDQSRARGKARPLEEHFATMHNYFTPREWQAVRACGPDEAEMEACFRQHWSLKEAFTKARGDGIAFEFRRIEFSLFGGGGECGTAATAAAATAAAPTTEGGAGGPAVRLHERASVSVDGQQQLGWRFDIQPLSAAHWVSVARGPPDDALDEWASFRATFALLCPAAPLLQEHMQRAEPRFEARSVMDLVPGALCAAYEAAGRDPATFKASVNSRVSPRGAPPLA